MLNLLSLLVGTLYVGMGIFVVIYRTFAVRLEPAVANGLGVVLIVYGIFRISRAILRLRKKDEIQ